MKLVNGYTTSFTEGLTGAANIYRITLEAVGEGSANLTISPASSSKFAASAPRGLKVGHTNSNGDPNSSVYPASLSITSTLSADFDDSNDVNWADFATLGDQWMLAPGVPSADIAPPSGNGVVDFEDFKAFWEQWLIKL